MLIIQSHTHKHKHAEITCISTKTLHLWFVICNYEISVGNKCHIHTYIHTYINTAMHIAELSPNYYFWYTVYATITYQIILWLLNYQTEPDKQLYVYWWSIPQKRKQWQINMTNCLHFDLTKNQLNKIQLMNYKFSTSSLNTYLKTLTTVIY